MKAAAILLLLPALSWAGDLELVSTTTIREGAGQIVVPCVRNHGDAPRHARFRSGPVEWGRDPLAIPPGETACFRLDASWASGSFALQVEEAGD